HNPDDISILDVSPAVGHRTATERWAQTGHRRSVSNPRLVFDLQHPQAARDLVGQPAAFVGQRASRQEARRGPAINGGTVPVSLDEVRVAIFLHEPRDAIHREIPSYALELVGARLAIHRVFHPRLRPDVIDRSRALWAKRTPIYRVIRVALNMCHLKLAAIFLIWRGKNHHPATHGTIRTDCAGFLRMSKSERPNVGSKLSFRFTKSESAYC